MKLENVILVGVFRNNRRKIIMENLNYKFYGVRNSQDLSKSGVYEIANVDYDTEIREKGVKSKKFVDRKSAEQFVKLFLKSQHLFFENGKVSRDKVDRFNQNVYQTTQDLKPNQAIAFTDGSYKDGKAGYGIVMFYKNKKLPISKPVKDDSKEIKAQNICAEIEGVKAAIKLAEKENITDLTIYFDSEGLADWVLGFNKSKRPLTRKYNDFYKEASKTLSITWIRVPAHHGVIYNEEADELARRAIM